MHVCRDGKATPLSGSYRCMYMTVTVTESLLSFSRNMKLSNPFRCRRTMQDGVTQPEGQLLGHTEGVTHVSARGDGIHLISNAKDSTVRLWDLRMMTPGSQCVPRSETVCSHPSLLVAGDARLMIVLVLTAACVGAVISLN